MFEEDGKFKLADHAGLYTMVFPSAKVRQWWIDNYYRKIGVVEFVEGRPVTQRGEVIAIVVGDSILRDFVSRLVAYQYGGFELLDCDLTRGFCRRLLEDPSRLVGRALVWGLPLPARPLRYYEEDFAAKVLPVACKLPCVLIVAVREGYLPKTIERMCTKRVDAVLRGAGIDYRCYDYRTNSRQRYLIPLEGAR